jgi:ribosomal protein S18 acetylase RimI-like enzyme
VRIRRAAAEDARWIASVYVRSWKGAYPGLIPQPYLDALNPEERIGMWEEVLSASSWPRQGVLVLLGSHGDHGAAPDHEAIIGFASFGPTRDDGVDASAVGELMTLYLDPAAFGSGAADILMDAALRALHDGGFSSAMLWVLGANARARRFYERRGWHHDGASKLHDWHAFVATDLRYGIELDGTAELAFAPGASP